MQQWPPKLLDRVFSFLTDEEKIRARLVSKFFDASLRPLVIKLDIKFSLDQTQLQALARSYPHLRELSVDPEYNERCGVLDFKAVKLPELRTLYCRACRIKDLHFTRGNTPVLERLTVNNAIGAIQGFKLDLPELTDIDIEYATVKKASGWGPSLSACPKLETFGSYKLWGLGLNNGKSHKLKLPNCRYMGLWRADDIDSLDLIAPKLERLDLQACYSIKRVHLAAGPGPTCEVVVVNANIPRSVKEHLLKHPRVGKKGVIRKDEVMTMMGGSGESGSESDSEWLEEDDDDLPGAPPLPAMKMEQWHAMLHEMYAHHPQNPFGR